MLRKQVLRLESKKTCLNQVKTCAMLHPGRKLCFRKLFPFHSLARPHMFVNIRIKILHNNPRLLKRPDISIHQNNGRDGETSQHCSRCKMLDQNIDVDFHQHFALRTTTIVVSPPHPTRCYVTMFDSVDRA